METKVVTDLSSIWNYILWTFEGFEITVRKFILAIAIIFVFYIITKFVRLLLRKHFLHSSKIDKHGYLVLERIVVLIIFLMGIFFAFRVIHIPLSAFAFVGGTLAIGIGFGIKELVNNIISGFIIMFERPIKIGDVVEINKQAGNVSNIRLRYTTVIMQDNTVMVLPNSYILENVFNNWTLKNSILRISVPIGLDYSSDINKATKLMLEAMSNNQRILKKPEPFVLFREHGHSSLNFEVYCYTIVNKAVDQLLLKSEINYALNNILRKNGVVIAFPQRDVHLDVKHPIDINLASRKA